MGESGLSPSTARRKSDASAWSPPWAPMPCRHCCHLSLLSDSNHSPSCSMRPLFRSVSASVMPGVWTSPLSVVWYPARNRNVCLESVIMLRRPCARGRSTLLILHRRCPSYRLFAEERRRDSSDRIGSLPLDAEISVRCTTRLHPDLPSPTCHSPVLERQWRTELQNQYKGLVLAGNMRDGIGMGNRIHQGAAIAETWK